MKALVINADAPYCILRLTDARAYVPASHTDIRKTFEAHRPIRTADIQDDYELTDALGYLEQPGAFA